MQAQQTATQVSGALCSEWPDFPRCMAQLSPVGAAPLFDSPFAKLSDRIDISARPHKHTTVMLVFMGYMCSNILVWRGRPVLDALALFFLCRPLTLPSRLNRGCRDPCGEPGQTDPEVCSIDRFEGLSADRLGSKHTNRKLESKACWVLERCI